MSAYVFQIAREKYSDFVLIIYMKKYEIAYHNYAGAKRVHRVQMTLCVRSNNNIQ